MKILLAISYAMWDNTRMLSDNDQAVYASRLSEALKNIDDTIEVLRKAAQILQDSGHNGRAEYLFNQRRALKDIKLNLKDL